jgi:hypothetical protein
VSIAGHCADKYYRTGGCYVGLAPLSKKADAWEPFNVTFAPAESVVTVYINQEGSKYTSVVYGLTVLQLTGGLFLLVRPFAAPKPLRCVECTQSLLSSHSPFRPFLPPTSSFPSSLCALLYFVPLYPRLCIVGACAHPTRCCCVLLVRPFAERVYVSWEPARTQLDAAVRCWCAPLRNAFMYRGSLRAPNSMLLCVVGAPLCGTAGS